MGVGTSPPKSWRCGSGTSSTMAWGSSRTTRSRPDLEDLLLREATLEQPADPCRAVLNEVAALLARHDWTGVLKSRRAISVVFIAEHDEGYAPKAAMLSARPTQPTGSRNGKPNWPPGASQDDEYG